MFFFQGVHNAPRDMSAQRTLLQHAVYAQYKKLRIRESHSIHGKIPRNANFDDGKSIKLYILNLTTRVADAHSCGNWGVGSITTMFVLSIGFLSYLEITA